MLQDRLFLNALIVSLIIHILALIAFSVITFHTPEIRQIVPVDLITLKEGNIPAASSKESTAPKSAVKEPPLPEPEPKKVELEPTKSEPKVIGAPDLDSSPETESRDEAKDRPLPPKVKAPEKVDLSSAVTLKPEEVEALVRGDLRREAEKRPIPSEKEEGLATKSTLKESLPSEPKKIELAAKKVDLAAQLKEKVEIKAASVGPSVSEDSPKAPDVKKAESPLTDKAQEKYPPKVGENEASPSKQEVLGRKTKEEERASILPASISPQKTDDQIKKAKEVITEKAIKQGSDDKASQLKPPEAVALKDSASEGQRETPPIDRPEPRRIDSKEGPETVISVPGGNFEIKWSGLQREVLEKVIPEYPEKAQREGIKPIITLRFWLKPNGEVDRVVIERTGGYRELDSLAVEAMRKWRFNPLVGDHNPEMQQGTITMRYELRR